jgi:hypothetical protein
VRISKANLRRYAHEFAASRKATVDIATGKEAEIRLDQWRSSCRAFTRVTNIKMLSFDGDVVEWFLKECNYYKDVT